MMFEDNGNKCGKCQNHEFEVLKKGHAKECPFKRCECLKCRLLDARSDILQVISGKETKLKGTKKDPNCGFCQNHGVKILRKGHVRSCGFGQERHFKLDNCFDCEVHYIRNEVNRLQIKMRRAMKEDRSLSEEQRKTAREAITTDEVEKVCDMARLARRKRETLITQQVGEPSGSLHTTSQSSSSSPPSTSSGLSDSGPLGPTNLCAIKREPREPVTPEQQHLNQNHLHLSHQHQHQHQRQRHDFQQQLHLDSLEPQADLWRPWSQQQDQMQNQLSQHHSIQMAHQSRNPEHMNQFTGFGSIPLAAANMHLGLVQSPPHSPQVNPLSLNLNSRPPSAAGTHQSMNGDSLSSTQTNLQEQQLLNTLFRLIVAQWFAVPAPVLR